MEMGHLQLDPTPVMCDNDSTLQMAFNGRGNFSKSRGIETKMFGVHYLVQIGAIAPCRVSTENNWADVLTKHLSTIRKFQAARSVLFGKSSSLFQHESVTLVNCVKFSM